jgi:hypothetical protein
MASKVVPQRAAEDLPENVPPAETGEAVFVTSSNMRRMTLWVDWEKAVYNQYGRKVPDRRDIQFVGGVYRTRVKREIDILRKARGYGKDFFELSDIRKMADEAKLKSALASADDPEVAAALRVKLGVTEHTMPDRETQPES